MKLSILKYHIKRILCWLLDFPGWLHGKESACQCRRHGFDPCSGKILHAVMQLSPCATTIEPVLQTLGTTTSEAPMT